MRLVFPTDEDMGFLSKRGAHFGKAKFYTIITLTDSQIFNVEVVPNKGHSNGGCGDAVANIMELSPDALIVSGIGSSPAQKFEDAGLVVYFDKDSRTVQESIESFTNKKLNAIGSKGTCSQN